ncbi:MAG: hypothetical protein O2819_06865 [Planctomycetota bacterium]|nr:hypothetical protein [Planctomycetota bacterium]MDA1105177.1 hypothetical protein [Planctomycetota bacterium]
MTREWLLLLLFSVGLAGTAALFGLALVAWRGRAAKGRHCPRCDHQQPPLPEPLGPGATAPDSCAVHPTRCTECGHQPRRGFPNRRSPRRGRALTLVALALAFVGLIAYRGGLVETRPISLVPSSALSLVAEWWPESDLARDACGELAFRVASTLPGDELIPAVDRAVRATAADPHSPLAPVTEAWFQLEPDRAENDACRRASEEWAALLLTTPPSLHWLPEGDAPTIETSAHANTLLWVSIETPALFLRPSETRPAAELELTIQSSALGAPSVYRWRPYGSGSFSMPVPVARPTESPIEPVVTLTLREREWPGSDWSTCDTRKLSVRVKPIECRPTGRDSEELRQAVREALGPELWCWEDGTRFGFRFNPRRTSSADDAATRIGLRIEVREGIAVRRLSRIWWDGSGSDFEIPVEDLLSLARARASTDAWSLRITGDRDMALRATHPADPPPTGDVSWWDGEIVVPLALSPIAGPAPPRRWERVDTGDLRTLFGPSFSGR